MPIVEIDGRRQIVARAYGTERVCACGCGESFTVTSITGRQKYASDRCKKRMEWRSAASRSRVVTAARERNRRWCEQNRGVRRQQPWLLGPPPFGQYLPGGAIPMTIRPMPERPRLEHARHVHGMISGLRGEEHHPQIADFSLIPWRGGWGVYFRDEESALRLAATKHAVRIWGCDGFVSFGPMHRLKAPSVLKRGRQRVRVDAVSPVCIRESHRDVYTAPTAAALRSTLEAWQAKRLGVQCDKGQLCVDLIERGTFPATIQLGGKFGAVRGWLGYVVLEVNAPTMWLLKTAAVIGLGGRTAFGFGRVKVTQ